MDCCPRISIVFLMVITGETLFLQIDCLPIDLKSFLDAGGAYTDDELAIVYPVARHVVRSIVYPQQQHLTCNAFGHGFDLKLQRNDGLFPSNFTIERVMKNSTRVEVCPLGLRHRCHYVGRTNDVIIALSSCNGWNGIIQTTENEYFILKSHSNKVVSPQTYQMNGRQHLLIRRRRHSTKEEDEILTNERLMKLLGGAKHRRVRSETKESRDIETLIVTDAGMTDFHGNDLETYILTVINIVSTLYKSPTLDNSIAITFVRWLRLEHDQVGLNITHDASSTLRSFCAWQANMFPSNETSTLNVDVAILLTRGNIGKTRHTGNMHNEEMLGLSDREGACSSLHRCVVAEDNGLAVAFTIAHEIGHSLGMKHDGEDNSCSDKGHIMSSRPVSGQGAFTWSSCSAQYLRHFLNSSKSSCLQNTPPTVDMKGRSDDKPGQVYDANSQCKLAFNDSLDECPGKMAECKMLWCLRPLFIDDTTGLRCTSNLIPKMDGTNCGEGKWCDHGQCVDRYANIQNEHPSIVYNETRNHHSTVTCYGIGCLDKTNSNNFSDDNIVYEDPVRFTSPNFPDEYPMNTDQSDVIKAPPDHVVDIEFYVFHLEQHSLCLYDYLQIIDVSSEEYTLLCGLLSTPFHMTSQGSILRLEFHSDSNVQKPGFLAKIMFLPAFVMNKLNVDTIQNDPMQPINDSMRQQ